MIFFDLLAPSTSSLIQTGNYYVYHDQPLETCPDTGEVFVAYLGLRGYLNYSKHFLVVTTFISLILYATNYILVVHTLTNYVSLNKPYHGFGFS